MKNSANNDESMITNILFVVLVLLLMFTFCCAQYVLR